MSARVVVVTGASSGVGRALAARAAQGGYGVVAVARRGDLLADLARETGGTVGQIEPLSLDLLEPGAAGRVIGTALRRFGRIDVLVNNAGSVATGPIAEQSDAALREQFMLHAIVPLALLREALPALLATRGQVFFVGSGVARVPVSGLGAYPSAKAAVRNAARIARNELRSSGIAVTYVDPGAVDTDFMRRAGFVGAPSRLGVTPHEVARKMMRAVATRQAVVNAAPWQTALVALAEWFPSATDAVLARFPEIVGTLPAPAGMAPEPAPLAAPVATKLPAPPQTEFAPPSAFNAALAPVARRMERLKLSRPFVAGLLREGTVLEADEVALRWAGMPNKNERAVTHEVLEALADAQFLERAGDGRYTVVREADS